MRNFRSIIYVNFAQYENVGRILDYLLDNFSIVLQFSFDHLRLKRGHPSTFLKVYENGKLIKEIKLIRLSVPEPLRFPSLPLLAILMFLQTVWYTFVFKKTYKKFDYYLTLDAFSAWIGSLLRTIRLVDKTIFWVGDYFPLNYPQWQIRLLRWAYWQFDKPSFKSANRLIFTNQRLLKLYRRLKVLPQRKTFVVVPIGTKPQTYLHTRPNCIIGFLGMIKNSMGLELLFDILPNLLKEIPRVKIEIVGSGPEIDYYRKKAKRFTKRVIFYGFIENQDEIHKIVRKWTIGLAPYQPVKSNESYWGDPSKIKVYLSIGVPIITTNVSYMASQISKSKAGIVVDYYKSHQFIDAVKTIIKNKELFQKNAFKLAQKYDYKKLYKRVFNHI